MCKKRYTISVFILVLALIMTLMAPMLSASADVLIEPDSDFYNKNREKMIYIGRNYYANGENGSLVLLVEPNARREVARFENGVILNIMFMYDDNGRDWGVTEVLINNRNVAGWVPMDELYLVYDSIAFVDEFEHEFTIVSEYETAFDIAEMDIEGDLILWTWPGSGVISWVFEREHLMEETNMGSGNTTYTDVEGREWGLLNYFYGQRNIWICLDDPSNPDIPAFNKAPEPVLKSASQVPEGDEPVIGSDESAENTGGILQSILSQPMLAISLVSLVAMLSLVLIRVFWSKEKK